MRRRCLITPVLVLIAGAAFAEPTARELRDRLEAAETGSAASGLRLLDATSVQRFYRQREYRPAWIGVHCESSVEALARAVEASEAHGLESVIYHRDALARGDRCDLDLELRATDAWLSLAAHLHAGRVDPVGVDSAWSLARPEIDLAGRLEAALADGQVARALLALAPDESYYRAMQVALARFRGYAALGGWAGVDDGPNLRAGDAGSRVRQLRSRLEKSGLLDPARAGSDAPFDENLETAVRAFQRRANLEPDGIVGPMTLHQLNQRVTDRIAQLRANLERWRWLPDDLGERHLRVNIADFRLEAWSQGAIERRHKVIVGKPYRRTPVFSDRIRYIVVNPWWETPRRLAVLDKLPLFARDPSQVERLGFQVVDVDGTPVDPDTIDWRNTSAGTFPYRLRQAPGPENALGRVKLMFPNPYQVYLHDTPTQGLFAKVRRDFSSGCIRVENALELAAWVVAETPGWDRARIDAAVASGRETTVPLARPVPVHVLYLTVLEDREGGVRFVDDLYGRDPAVLAALGADGTGPGTFPVPVDDPR